MFTALMRRRPDCILAEGSGARRHKCLQRAAEPSVAQEVAHALALTAYLAKSMAKPSRPHSPIRTFA
eukprot:5525088-Pyramimonas_sp.AAC.1